MNVMLKKITALGLAATSLAFGFSFAKAAPVTYVESDYTASNEEIAARKPAVIEVCPYGLYGGDTGHGLDCKIGAPVLGSFLGHSDNIFGYGVPDLWKALQEYRSAH